MERNGFLRNSVSVPIPEEVSNIRASPSLFPYAYRYSLRLLTLYFATGWIQYLPPLPCLSPGGGDCGSGEDSMSNSQWSVLSGEGGGGEGGGGEGSGPAAVRSE